MNWWCGVGGEDACVMNYEGCLDDRWKMEWAADLPRVRAYCAVYCMRFTKYDYQKPRLPSSQLNLNSISTILKSQLHLPHFRNVGPRNLYAPVSRLGVEISGG